MVNLTTPAIRNTNNCGSSFSLPSCLQAQQRKIQEIFISAVDYLWISCIQIASLYIGLGGPIALPLGIIAIAAITWPITIGVTTGISLARAYDFLQVPENRYIKIAFIALAILGTYHAPVTGLIAFIVYHGLTASTLLQKITREYLGTSEMVVEGGWGQDKENSADYYVIPPQTTLADKDWETFTQLLGKPEFYHELENAKAALLECRVVAVSMDCFSKIKERVYHYCPPVKHLFHPIDFIYSCLDPKTRRTNDLFAKACTQLKFLVRHQVAITATVVTMVYLTFVNNFTSRLLGLGVALATGITFSSAFKFNEKVLFELKSTRTLSTRIFISIIVLGSFTLDPLYTLAYCVSTVAFLSIPSLIKVRESFGKYIVALGNGRNSYSNAPPLRIKEVCTAVWEENKRIIKTWGAALLRSTPTENVGNTN